MPGGTSGGALDATGGALDATGGALDAAGGALDAAGGALDAGALGATGGNTPVGGPPSAAAPSGAAAPPSLAAGGGAAASSVGELAPASGDACAAAPPSPALAPGAPGDDGLCANAITGMPMTAINPAQAGASKLFIGHRNIVGSKRALQRPSDQTYDREPILRRPSARRGYSRRTGKTFIRPAREAPRGERDLLCTLPRSVSSESSRSLSGVAAPGDPHGSSALRLLNFERCWLVAIFAIMIPAGTDERFPIGAAQAPMGRFIDDLLAHAPLEFVTGLRATLWMVMLAPLFTIGRFATFLGLEHEAQMRVVERLRTSDVYLVRETPLLFKTIGCLGFCGLPPVQKQLGINPTDARPPAWAREDKS